MTTCLCTTLCANQPHPVWSGVNKPCIFNRFVTQLSSGYSAQGEVSDASLPPYNDNEDEGGDFCDTYAGLANTVQRAQSSLTPNYRATTFQTHASGGTATASAGTHAHRYSSQQGVVDSEALLQEYRQQQQQQQQQQQGLSTADGTTLATNITGTSTDNTNVNPKPQLVKSHRKSIAAVRAMVANKCPSSSAKHTGTRARRQGIGNDDMIASSWPSTGNSTESRSLDFGDFPTAAAAAAAAAAEAPAAAAAASEAQSANQLESVKQARVVQHDVVSVVEREITVLQQRFLAHGTSLPLTRQPALDVADGCDEFLL